MHDIEKLIEELKELQSALSDLTGSDDQWDDLFRIIHFPGWTTPPEFMLVMGLATGMTSQVRALKEMKMTLWEASKMIGGGGEMKQGATEEAMATPPATPGAGPMASV